MLLEHLLLHGSDEFVTLSFSWYERRVEYLQGVATYGLPAGSITHVSVKDLTYFNQNVEKSINIRFLVY